VRPSFLKSGIQAAVRDQATSYLHSAERNRGKIGMQQRCDLHMCSLTSITTRWLSATQWLTTPTQLLYRTGGQKLDTSWRSTDLPCL
jgi:hypothetical protein